MVRTDIYCTKDQFAPTSIPISFAEANWASAADVSTSGSAKAAAARRLDNDGISLIEFHRDGAG